VRAPSAGRHSHRKKGGEEGLFEGSMLEVSQDNNSLSPQRKVRNPMKKNIQSEMNLDHYVNKNFD